MSKCKKYICILFLLCALIILFKIIININIMKTLKIFIYMLIPFIIAFSIAYILNPIMCYLEKKFNMKRLISILSIYTLVTTLVILFVTIVFPRIAKSIGQIIIDMPKHMNNTQNWIDLNIMSSKYLQKFGIDMYIESNINHLINKISYILDSTFSNLVSKTINITSIMFKFFLGLVISVYLLKDKEEFIGEIKKLIYGLLDKNTSVKIIKFGKEVDNIVYNFIIGKFLDSLIVGVICLIGFLLLKVPYALLMSIIIGCANMIPYFGPIIGMIPSVIITFLYDPIRALYVIIFILIVQQFDGLYLEPKILEDKIGLNPFWIIFAIVIGGECLGILGMFIAVPIFAIIKLIFQQYINKRLILKK